MSLLQNLLDRRDTRIDGWPFMSSPVPVVVLVGAYVYFVKSLGPRLMKDRAPVPVGTISRAFNLVQAVANLTLLYKFMVHGWLFRYSFTCQPVNYSSDDAEENIIVETCWWFFITKVAAMFETVFLVLLKRPDLITSFHVVDHALTPTFVWLGVRFVPGGHATFFAALNTFVQYQKNTWWRKHVTGLKALQYAAVFIHSAQLLVADEQCVNVPKEVAYAICGYCALLITLLCVENETEIKSRFAPLLWITNISEVVKNFMITLTSACAMDQSALYDSPGQELGHGEDHEHEKEE